MPWLPAPWPSAAWRRRWLPPVAVIVAAVVVAVPLRAVFDRDTTAAGSAGGESPSAIAEVLRCGPGGADAGRCRFSDEYRHRGALSEEQQAAAARAGARISGAVAARARQSPLSVADVRAALFAAEADERAVVRIARPDDPAPAGSVVYAVPLEAGCLLGYVAGPADFLSMVMGRRPDGTCLGP